MDELLVGAKMRPSMFWLGHPLAEWSRFARLLHLSTARIFAFQSGDHPMPTQRASTILGAVEEARSELVGKAVVLTDGKAGTVDNVWLDELHGLRVSLIGHVGKWPISTIKFAQGQTDSSLGKR
jgi:hypothetical protein